MVMNTEMALLSMVSYCGADGAAVDGVPEKLQRIPSEGASDAGEVTGRAEGGATIGGGLYLFPTEGLGPATELDVGGAT